MKKMKQGPGPKFLCVLVIIGTCYAVYWYASTIRNPAIVDAELEYKVLKNRSEQVRASSANKQHPNVSESSRYIFPGTTVEYTVSSNRAVKFDVEFLPDDRSGMDRWARNVQKGQVQRAVIQNDLRCVQRMPA